VAAVYSANLAGSPGALLRASVGVDALIAAHGVPSDPALAMLFSHPRVRRLLLLCFVPTPRVACQTSSFAAYLPAGAFAHPGVCLILSASRRELQTHVPADARCGYSPWLRALADVHRNANCKPQSQRAMAHCPMCWAYAAETWCLPSSQVSQPGVMMLDSITLQPYQHVAVQVPKAAPPPPVLLRLTASLPKAGFSVRLGPASEGGANIERLEALLTGAVVTLAEDNEVQQQNPQS
jgi:hypothetical protein